MFKIATGKPEGDKTLKLIDGIDKKQNPNGAKRLKNVTVTVKPVDMTMRIAARHSAIRAVAGIDPVDPDYRARIEVAFCEAIGRMAITGWYGVYAKGKDPVPCTLENVMAALRDPDFYDAMDVVFFTPALISAKAEEDEKNV